MTNYTVTFSNKTTTTWTMVLYITLPAGTGLASVSWKQAVAPANGITSVGWTDTSYAVLANATSFNGLAGLVMSQAVTAPPDTAWNVVMQDSVQQLVANGLPLLKDMIQFNNISLRNANAGFGLDGVGAVYKSNLGSGQNIAFKPVPQYWVMLAEQMSIGEVITVTRSPTVRVTAAVSTTPQALSFPTNQTSATVTASVSGEVLTVAVTYQ